MAESVKKILVGMSGGVDSSVAAALLVEQGYDVTGAYMVNFDSKNDEEYGDKDLNLECWRADYRDAVRVAAHLGIKLIRLDFTKEYREFVLGYMFDEYEKGRTPNPDVMCNKIVKFDVWVQKAKELGFDALATGHYANKKCIEGSYALGTAKDQNKDQTYFLHQLNQEQLAFAEFPLGEFSKEEVRSLAKKFDLPTAEKEESMGICFVGEVPMNEFLQQKISKKPGDIILSSTGEVIGTHEGLTFYTIGQRNIGVESHLPGGDTRPLYVLSKQTEKNVLVVGFEDDPALLKAEVEVEDIHWIREKPDFPFSCLARMRHRQELQSCKVHSDTHIEFDTPQRAVTPGQFVVLYKNKECLGGAVVK